MFADGYRVTALYKLFIIIGGKFEIVRVILLGLINGKIYLNVFLNSLFFCAVYYLFLLYRTSKSDFNFYKKVKFNIYCVNQIGIIKYSAYIFYYDFFGGG